MIENLQILTCKPKILTDWIEYFIQFKGNGLFYTEIYAQPYAYILFNYNHVLEISYQEKNLLTTKSLLEPITLSPFTLSANINKETIIFGAKIKSTFLYLLTGIPLNLITGNILNFDEIFKDKVIDLIEKINLAKTISEKSEIAEDYLLSKIKSFQDNNLLDNYNAMKYLTQNFYSIFEIDQLIDKLNVSHRTLDRHFLKYTGVSPKAMLSLIRFSKTIDYAIKYKSFNLDTLWNFGYYDYAHFSKDFKKYCGKTFERFKQEIKIGENLQVSNQKTNILLPEILIY
jgi:AraC-like DNA-binding protein